MWIEGSVLPVLGPGGLEAVEVGWTFDDFNSSSLTALTVGLIPCPVSSALLAYGIAEGAVSFSLLLVAGVI
jgi:hypothetical protein